MARSCGAHGWLSLRWLADKRQAGKGGARNRQFFFRRSALEVLEARRLLTTTLDVQITATVTNDTAYTLNYDALRSSPGLVANNGYNPPAVIAANSSGTWSQGGHFVGDVLGNIAEQTATANVVYDIAGTALTLLFVYQQSFDANGGVREWYNASASVLTHTKYIDDNTALQGETGSTFSIQYTLSTAFQGFPTATGPIDVYYTPEQIRAAYGIDRINNGVNNDGAGQNDCHHRCQQSPQHLRGRERFRPAVFRQPGQRGQLPPRLQSTWHRHHQPDDEPGQ